MCRRRSPRHERVGVVCVCVCVLCVCVCSFVGVKRCRRYTSSRCVASCRNLPPLCVVAHPAPCTAVTSKARNFEPLHTCYPPTDYCAPTLGRSRSAACCRSACAIAWRDGTLPDRPARALNVSDGAALRSEVDARRRSRSGEGSAPVSLRGRSLFRPSRGPNTRNTSSAIHLGILPSVESL